MRTPKLAYRFYRGRFERQQIYGQQSSKSTPETVSPYGNMPKKEAGQVYSSFSSPLSSFFGVRPTGQKQGAMYDANMASIMGSDSPLAQFMRQAGGFLPTVFGQAQDAGSKIASMAPGLFDFLRQQIASGTAQLPQMQRAAAGATNRAQQGVEQAFSPIASNALFQNALRGTLESARSGAGARGLLDAGGMQGQEEALTRDIAAQYAQNQFGNQQAALQGLQGALGGQAGLAMLGPQLAEAQMNALPGLQQALMAGYQTPMDALAGVFQQLAGYQNPQLALLGLTGPQVASRTSSSGFNIL